MSTCIANDGAIRRIANVSVSLSSQLLVGQRKVKIRAAMAFLNRSKLVALWDEKCRNSSVAGETLVDKYLSH